MRSCPWSVKSPAVRRKERWAVFRSFVSSSSWKSDEKFFRGVSKSRSPSRAVGCISFLSKSKEVFYEVKSYCLTRNNESSFVRVKSKSLTKERWAVCIICKNVYLRIHDSWFMHQYIFICTYIMIRVIFAVYLLSATVSSVE